MDKKYVLATALALSVAVTAEAGVAAKAEVGAKDGVRTEAESNAGVARVAGESVIRLDDMVVTAIRGPEKEEYSLAAVTVITRQQIDERQFSTLAEALSTVPGLQILRSGGRGHTTRLSIRGTDSKHALILVDGLRVGSATTGATAIQHLPLSQIERIEVVRGPRSTLYGAGAIGGVIQIFTRRGGDEPRGQVALSGGSHDTHEVRAQLSGPLGDSHYSLALANLGTRGFDVQQNNVHLPTAWGPTPNQPDADGLRESSVSLRLGHRFTPGNEVEAQALHAAGNIEFDGDWQNETDFRQQALGLTARLRPLTFWNITIQGGQSRDDSQNLRNGVFSSIINTKKNQLSWQNDFQLDDHQRITMGVDYLQERVSKSPDDYVRTRRATTGVYLQHQLDYDRHSLVLGLRHEDNQQFGDHNTYSIGYGLQLPHNLRLTANYGTAFRAPTFNELYWPGFDNPNLRPEESRSYELALRQSFDRGHWRVGVFRTDIDHLISWSPISRSLENINQARIDGLELDSAIQLGEPWRLGLALTLLNPKDQVTDRLLPRRSRQTGTVNLDGDFGFWRVGLTAKAVSHHYDGPANTIRVAGYTLFSLRAAYDLTDNWLLKGRIENLFDHKYREVATYNPPGREAFVTLSYNF
ncbi:MAG: TonB-dependent receptor [Desulfobulbaceae bacterium]|nr:MAG: TonB-dependent receptor [Desulfobulbaceae bacterium]